MTRLTEQEQLKLGGDIQRRLGIKTSRNEPLARFSTMRVGGPADLFAEVYNLFELRGIARFARSRDIPLFLIGSGSDLVISDTGIGGLVVRVRAGAVHTDGERIVADPGVLMAKLATEGKKAGLSGLEFGLAIPGTVGGSVWANAGALGHELNDLCPGQGISFDALRVGREVAALRGHEPLEVEVDVCGSVDRFAVRHELQRRTRP